MRYYWLRDRQNQNQFDIYWHPGPENDTDYFTKHHPAKTHRLLRNRYVKDYISHMHEIYNSLHILKTSPYAAPVSTLRGCVNENMTHDSRLKTHESKLRTQYNVHTNTYIYHPCSTKTT